MSKPQQTIKQAISYQGIGLHSGEPVNMVFKPAPENTGIVFAGFVLAYYIWNIGKKKGIAAWIKAVTVCMTVCLALIPYVVWNLYVRCRFSGIEQKFQLAFGKQESLAVSKEQYGQITEEFVKAAFSTSNRAILAFFLCNIALSWLYCSSGFF